MTLSTSGIAPTQLLGRWVLERRVLDRRIGRYGRVNGTLELGAEGDGVRWVERGILVWDGQQLEVTRELRIMRRDDGWMVRFSDGRDFHPWSPGRLVTHPCRADTYRGLIAVSPQGSTMRALWDVSGPAKDQRLFTRCRRLDSLT